MLALRSPEEAYRRVDFDARIAGANPRDLVVLCYQDLDVSIGRIVDAHDRGDNAARSMAVTRALSAVTALQLGVDSANPLAPALNRFFDAARRTLLNTALAFDGEAVNALRGDFLDIYQAMMASPVQETDIAPKRW